MGFDLWNLDQGGPARDASIGHRGESCMGPCEPGTPARSQQLILEWTHGASREWRFHVRVSWARKGIAVVKETAVSRHSWESYLTVLVERISFDKFFQ